MKVFYNINDKLHRNRLSSNEKSRIFKDKFFTIFRSYSTYCNKKRKIFEQSNRLLLFCNHIYLSSGKGFLKKDESYKLPEL